MNQSMKKFISSCLTVATALSFSGLGLASSVQAGFLTSSSVNLSNTVAGATGVSYSFATRTGTTGDLDKITLQFSNVASGSNGVPIGFGAPATPGNGVLANMNITNNNGDTAYWSYTYDGAGLITLTRSSSITGVAAGADISFTLNNITNNSSPASGTSGQCDAINDSDTCYIGLTTRRADDSVIDTTTVTYTVVTPVTVTATVDPIMTFTVSGVPSGSVGQASTDANATGANVSSQPTSIPYGNLTVGIPKVASQQLNVLTNANGGYVVYHKFNQANVMTGTVGTNHIDRFDYNSATWTAPVAWHSPTSTNTNTSTAWLGMRTTDTRTGTTQQFGGASSGNDKWAPPVVQAGAGFGASPQAVMKTTGPDNGSYSVYVSYKIEANAYQPADQYTGTMIYDAVATY
jgi:hypothetical protein